MRLLEHFNLNFIYLPKGYNNYLVFLLSTKVWAWVKLYLPYRVKLQTNNFYILCVSFVIMERLYYNSPSKELWKAPKLPLITFIKKNQNMFSFYFINFLFILLGYLFFYEKKINLFGSCFLLQQPVVFYVIVLPIFKLIFYSLITYGKFIKYLELLKCFCVLTDKKP